MSFSADLCVRSVPRCFGNLYFFTSYLGHSSWLSFNFSLLVFTGKCLLEDLVGKLQWVSRTVSDHVFYLFSLTRGIRSSA